MAQKLTKKPAAFDAVRANHTNTGNSGVNDAHAIHVGPGMDHKTRLADAPLQPTRKPTYDRVQKQRHLNAGNSGVNDAHALHVGPGMDHKTRLPDAPMLDADIVDDNPA